MSLLFRHGWRRPLAYICGGSLQRSGQNQALFVQPEKVLRRTLTSSSSTTTCTNNNNNNISNSSSTTTTNDKSIKTKISNSDASSNCNPVIVDSEPSTDLSTTSVWSRLPTSTLLQIAPDKEFEHASYYTQKFEITQRIMKLALSKLGEPSAVALFTMSCGTVLGLGLVEASLLLRVSPYTDTQSSLFCLYYAISQVLPSCVWATQEATLVCVSMGLDPDQLLTTLHPETVSDARTLLTVQWLTSSRYMVAGFMLLAQVVRAGTLGAAAVQEYETNIRHGKEPPLLSTPSPIVVRLCGTASDCTVTSLQYMQRHLFPVFEQGKATVLQSIVEHLHRAPVFWSIPPRQYAYRYSWNALRPNESWCVSTKNMGKKVLIMEADGTNSGDPLSLGHHSLDLTLDDASQGFRRLQERFEYQSMPRSKNVRFLRVFLGHSLETFTSGGGHEYTLRHRIRYAKEVDILVDSRAPVLKEVLKWCDRVAGKDGTVLFQTNNQEYFKSLQLLLARYGYVVRDPLDYKFADKLDETDTKESESADHYESLLQILMEDPMDGVTTRSSHNAKGSSDAASPASPKTKHTTDRKRQIVRLARLPRLVYYGSTAETVNACQALLTAGAVDIANCCAILDKDEGTHLLQQALGQQNDLVSLSPMEWRRSSPRKADTDSSQSPSNHETPPSAATGLHIISSSTIYDGLFRQIREWTRLGYSVEAIQTELDVQYEEMLQQSRQVHSIVQDSTQENKASADTLSK